MGNSCKVNEVKPCGWVNMPTRVLHESRAILYRRETESSIAAVKIFGTVVRYKKESGVGRGVCQGKPG
jgi:hypothetical protein